MYGEPALPPDFVSLPYANPDAPKGGAVVFGNIGAFDSLNPFIRKGNPPWQLRFLGYESLMGRSWDEAFTLYGLLAESVETPEDRSWVEFTLRPEARFSDGSPVTVADVIWSYETLGTIGHLRYLNKQLDSIERTGERTVRLTFNTDNRELALSVGLRPILKKAQWDGVDFTASGLDNPPIGSSPYVISDFESNRYLTLTRNPDYWGKDLPLRRGIHNFDEIKIEFYGDQTALFEAFKGGALSAVREFNAEQWDRYYDFPAVQRGDIVKSEIPHQRPTGMTGFVMNTRHPIFADWRVREAMITAFNFEYINEAINGGIQKRIPSYFSNSQLGMKPGPATGLVGEFLAPYSAVLLPGTVDGYTYPVGDGTARNRANIRKARALLEDAGWTVEDGILKDADGAPFEFTVLLPQTDAFMQGNAGKIIDIYAQALERLGISMRIDTVDNAQLEERKATYDFDMTTYRRAMSLSPGNEQYLYFGSEGVDAPGTRNLMGANNPAIDGLINTMLTAPDQQDFVAATRALDRVLTAGRYVIPVWQFDVGRIAHIEEMKYPELLPIYGDLLGFMPDVWWYQTD
ncbi:MAG: ABC transporter substrate-binding protein [Rhodobacteraceae bacterium]|nr:ABC transporter substrate-binding protein [Paracoccaceae bacterium]